MFTPVCGIFAILIGATMMMTPTMNEPTAHRSPPRPLRSSPFHNAVYSNQNAVQINATTVSGINTPRVSCPIIPPLPFSSPALILSRSI